MSNIVMRPDTSVISNKLGQTFCLTIASLLLIIGIAEWGARSEAFQALFTYPQLGSRHYQLGHKLALLDAEVKRNGPVDCIMVGSSMMDMGLDPEMFQAGYQETSGHVIRCFNFGIDASSAASTAVLTKILIEDYQPSLLIIGTDARDYTIPPTDRDATVILETPWIQYRQGHFSMEGWLTEHSHFYRYRQHLSRLIHFNFENTLRSETESERKTLINGYTSSDKVADYINNPPDPRDDSYEVVYYSRIYRSYQLLDENLDALESILEYNGSRTQVIVVEMPVSDGLYYFFGNGKADYDLFLSRVNELADQHHVPLLRTEQLDLIPDNGWRDYNHLNTTGAKIFSAWLGRHVAGMDIP